MLRKILLGLLTIIFIGCSNSSRQDYYKNYYKNHSSNLSSSKGDRIDYYGSYPKDSIYVADKIEYLEYVNDMESPKYPIRTFSELEFLNFYKNLSAEGYGDASPYWRWHFKLTNKEINDILNKRLPTIYKNRPREVLTLSSGKWVQKSVPLNPVGELQELKVLQRGKSGVIIKLLVRGTRGTYLVAKEGNVRSLFSLSKSNVGNTVNIYGAKGGSREYSKSPISRNPASLPSGYFAFQKTSSGYSFYGGGFGHGVGVPQWTAMDLTRNKGMNYKRVLERYYPHADLKKMSSIKGMGKNIKVGIMTTGFGSLEHSKITLYSAGKMKVRSQGGNVDIPARTQVDFINKDGYVNVIYGGKIKLRTKHYISVTSNEMISVPSIKRNIKKYKYPTYRGRFEIRLSNKAKGKVRLINEVAIEDYLLQVVPSEMPESFGLEALKVQAVAARTYAAKDYIRNRYEKDGFHILDSTQSQVYNNLDENPTATSAVKSTKDYIMIYNGKPIDAKYYSTSSGYNADANNVW